MITENLSTLKIYKLTQEQYDRELAANNIDESALYLTPEIIDQNYNADSENAQSGKAVAESINLTQTSETKEASGESIHITDISPIEHTMIVKARSKNFITNTDVKAYGNTTVSNGEVTQKDADDRSSVLLKCQGNNTYTLVRKFETKAPVLGMNTLTFKIITKDTTDTDNYINRIVFGCNGKTRDTTIYIDVTNLPVGDYVISANFTNITEGTISWKDMMIAEGLTETSYTPFVDVSTAEVVVNDHATYPINADGIVENVKSTHPTITLEPSMEGVILDVTYYSRIGIDYIISKLNALNMM